MNKHNQIYRTASIEQIAFDDIKLPEKMVRKFSKNARRLAAKQIEKFGFLIPILIDKDNVIRGGTLFYLAAQQLELVEIPAVRVTHLSDEQLRAYTIAEQKLSELPTWNEEALASEFEFLTALDLNFDIELTGFSVTEIDRLVNSAAKSETEEVAPPALAERAVTQLGDVWALGAHRVICGSALSSEVWGVLMDGQKSDLLFTDPPYNVRINGHVSGKGSIRHREFKMASGEMTSTQYQKFLLKFLTLGKQYSREGSLHYICIDWRHVADVIGVGLAVLNKLINICCWAKPNAGMGSFYRSRHELIVVFRNGATPHRNNIELGRHGRYRSNVWEYAGATSFSGRSSEEGNTLAMHPTAKPVAMVADAILDSTKRNEVVVDPFLGSGTTLMAAERIGRKLYGVELDPLYVDVAIRRWQRQTGDDALHLTSGKSFSQIEGEMENAHD